MVKHMKDNAVPTGHNDYRTTAGREAAARDQGVIVIGHGSRREGANEDFVEFARELQSQDVDAEYRAAFLSNGRPGLEDAARDMAARGIRRIVVVPVFLSAGSHVREDIPRIIQQVRDSCPELQVVQAEHVGAHPGLAALVREQAARAAREAPAAPAAETAPADR